MLKNLLPKEGFNRNVLTLMTGTAIAQVIPLAITPILTRIYSPEQFGVFALFAAAASTLSTVATGRYELAIMLPRKDSDAANITILSILINFLVSTLLLLMACIFNDRLTNMLGSRAISTWLYFVPLTIFLNGLYISLNYWSNRKKLYKLMANRRIIQSAGTAGVQLGLGLLRSGSSGLVIGSIAGQGLAVGIMGKMVFDNDPKIYKSISKIKILALAKRYINFPKFLVPAHTLSALSSQLPAILINFIFGLATSGFFMLAERVIGSPISLISTAIGDVFRQQISQAYIVKRNCKVEFESALKKLLLISIPPFIIFSIIAPTLFAWIFGEKWRISGEYAQIMSPMFFLRFITNPLSNVTIIAQKNKYELYWQTILLLTLVTASWIDYMFPAEAKRFIIIFTAIYSILYIVDLIANYRFACAMSDMKHFKPLKYLIGQLKTEPKAEISNNFGLLQNPQICPQCGTVNIKRQTTCIMCARALDAETVPADDHVVADAITSTIPTKGKYLPASKESPDSLKRSLVMDTAAPPSMPDLMTSIKKIDTVDEKKWLRWKWKLVFFLFLLMATGLLVFLLRLSFPASPDAKKITNKIGSTNSVPMPTVALVADVKQKVQIIAPEKELATPEIAPGPSQQSADTRTSTNTSIVKNMLVQPAAKRVRIRTVPEVPVAPAPQQQEASALINSPCTDAQRALALCDIN